MQRLATRPAKTDVDMSDQPDADSDADDPQPIPPPAATKIEVAKGRHKWTGKEMHLIYVSMTLTPA